MKPIPRIEIIKNRTCCGHRAEMNFMRYGIAYSEDYEVRVIIPNRPLKSRSNLSRQQANSLVQLQLSRLKKENYDSVVYDGRIIKF